jgi:hypothetical protein
MRLAETIPQGVLRYAHAMTPDDYEGQEFRRFGALRTHMLLLQQSQLTDLENDLNGVSKP